MDAAEVLKKYFGYDSFKTGQEDIVRSVLSGRDVLAVAPSDIGKHICYQVPALMLSGITIVVSPLAWRTRNQVKALNEAGIHAAYINSLLSENQISKALELAESGRYQIVYVHPKWLEDDRFLQFARNSEISMVTVDEAHRLSRWGQDFRAGYQKIGDFIDGLPVRPVVSAFTATAAAEVKEDIGRILKLDCPDEAVAGVDRENLYYSVEYLAGKQKNDYIVRYIEECPGESGIICCSSWKSVDFLCRLLSERGISVVGCHARLSASECKDREDDFICGRAQVMVAASGFGREADKPDVRFVIHYDIPGSIEDYYQEAERAGRDGEPARCIILFSVQDAVIRQHILKKKTYGEMDAGETELSRKREADKLWAMERYCKTEECLRNYILGYFGGKEYTACGNCGNCCRSFKEEDVTAEAKWVVNCIAETQGKYGQTIVARTLLGVNNSRLEEVGATKYKSYGALRQMRTADVYRLIDHMVAEGYLVRTEGEYPLLQMGDISEMKREDARVMLRVDSGYGAESGWTSGDRARKDPFYLNPEDALGFAYAEYSYVSEIADRLNDISSAGNAKKLERKVIYAYLLSEGLLKEEERDGKTERLPTEQGLELGIKIIDKVAKSGKKYQLLLYPENVQRMIVEHFIVGRG